MFGSGTAPVRRPKPGYGLKHLRRRRVSAGDIALEERQRLAADRRISPLHAARAMRAVIMREIVKFIHQFGRLASALVRPGLWLVVFAAGFQKVLGVSI